MYVINETAELVKCLCCGAEKYSTRKPFICHRCWRTGKAAEHMQQLTQLAPDLPHGGLLCEVVVDEEGGTKIYPIETASR